MRLKSMLLASMFATIVFGTVASGAPALANPPSRLTCSGTPAAPETIPGGAYLSVSMPSGSFCSVNGPVTILGPMKLEDSAALAVMGGSLTIRGPLKVSPNAVLGNVNNTAPIEIDGPVSVGSHAALIIGVESPGAPIVSAIRGPVGAHDASTVQIHNTRISGPVSLVGGGGENAILSALAGPGANFNDLEDNQILGPVNETGYDGVWAGVIRNRIYGPMTFADNAEPPVPPGSPFENEYDIGSNRIYGPATCDDNNPAPNMGMSTGSPSIVYGPVRGDQAATCTGVPTGQTGPPV